MSELDDLFEDVFGKEEKKEEKTKSGAKAVITPKPQKPKPEEEEKTPEDVLVEAIVPKAKAKAKEEITESIVPVVPPEPPAEQKKVEEKAKKKAKAEQEKSIPVKALRPALPTAKEFEFDFSEEKIEKPKEVILIYGHKGHGKTFLAMSFPGIKVVLSFDRKSALVKYKDYKNDKNIKVYDVVKYLNYSTPQKWLETADLTFRYLNALLDHVAQNPPDWIVIDGTEIFQQICEMTMRYRNNLMPFQGIANLNLWKERRLYIRQIHNKALSIAKRGIIYTTYVDKDEIVVDGEIIAKKDVPKWIDAIMYETDTVIRVTAVSADAEGGARRFIATVESSKGSLPTGLKVEVTNLGYKAFITALKGT